MPEEGEIPEYLKESVPSAEGYKQGERRAYQIAETAWRLRIPKDSLDNATVRRYVGVLHDLEAARERLEWPEGMEDASPEGSVRADRENQVRALYMAAEMLLTDGLGDQRRDPAQLRHYFDDLARRYGGEVSYDRVSDRAHPDTEPPSASAPLWTGRARHEPAPQPPWHEAAGGQDGSWWNQIDLPSERYDREHLKALDAEARRQGVPTDQLGRDPVTRGWLGRLVDARQLVADTTDLAGLPAAPGLTPAAKTRLAHIAPLNRLAVAVLEEQFHPGRLSPSQATGELNEVGQAYGLKIQ